MADWRFETERTGTRPNDAHMRRSFLATVILTLTLAITSIGPVLAQNTPFAACTSDDDPNDAIAQCSLVINDPGDFIPQARSIALDARGYAYLSIGDRTRGLEDFNAAITLDPTNANALNDRGTLHSIQGQLKAAIDDFTAAISIKPDVAYFRNRLDAYFKSNDDARALLDLDAIMRGGFHDATTMGLRCQTRARLGVALDDALDDCDAALRSAPTSPEWYDARAFLHLKRTEYKAAIGDYDRAIQLAPQRATALFGRGIAKALTGDTVGASADLAAARQIDPQIGQRFAGWGVKGYEKR